MCEVHSINREHDVKGISENSLLRMDSHPVVCWSWPTATRPQYVVQKKICGTKAKHEQKSYVLVRSALLYTMMLCVLDQEYQTAYNMLAHPLIDILMYKV